MISQAMTHDTGAPPVLGTLRLLVHEHEEADAELCVAELRRAGWDVRATIAVTLDAFKKEIRSKRFDVVISDYRFPGWTGLDALELLKSSAADVPFVLVSGALGDEIVVECLRRGATDYVLKSNLSRLPLTVERARNETKLREDQDWAIETLRNSEARYRSIVSFAPLGIYQASDDGTIFTANTELATILGYASPEDLVGMNLAQQVYADPAKGTSVMEKYPASGKYIGVEMVWKRRDGTPIWVQLDSHEVPHDHAATHHFEGFVRNITARKQAEEALRASERSYRRIVDTAFEGIWTVDADGRTTYVNPQMCEMLGYAAHEVVGHLLGDYLHKDSKAIGYRVFAGGGQTVGGEEEVRFCRKDGSDLWATLSSNPIVTDEGRVVGGLAMVTDLTARKQLEWRFLQAQRMESVGRLAGGVAHDFNNLLSVIIGWTEMAVSELPSGHTARKSLEEVLSAGQGAAQLTRKLLAFSRQQVAAPTVFNPNALVAEVDDTLHRLIGEDIEFAIRTDPDLGTVSMDRGQLEQVLMNLVVNARDAMPDGGTLTIETANKVLDAEYASQTGDLVSGQYVVIAVTDTGVGMSEEVKSHLFEPFFTTKVLEKGTGLGLSTCHGIVKQAGGQIEVESEVGVGTTLRLFLPRCLDTSTGAAVRGVRAASALGAETILLVEDENAVRRVTTSMLEARGFRVVSTASGEGALRLIEEAREPLHLLLTDVILAGRMNGVALAERARLVWPELPVLFVSGYTNDMSALRDIRAKNAAFLQKPFTGDALGQKVRDVLDAERGSRTANGA